MRVVMHIDMDAFFAAVEERYNPQFRGKPIVVCTSTPLSVDPSSSKIEFEEIVDSERPRSINHSELVEGSSADPKGGRGRGVVSTASYAARKFGIKSAMPISQAWRLAEEARRRGEPETIFLSGNHQLYGEVSERIMALLEKRADAFEQASVDEAYLQWEFPISNFQFSNGSWVEAEKKARAIKRAIFKQEGLTCSVGIGPNKLVAKIASDFRKPDGLIAVRPTEVEKFLAPLSVRAIPGIGPKAEAELSKKGIRIIGDLQKTASAELVELFGKWGEDMSRHAHGISDSPVSNEGEAKSVGEQETFEKDTLDATYILDRAGALAEQVVRRFQADGFKSFGRVVVTVRFADFTTRTRSHTLPRGLRTLAELRGESLRLLLPFLDKRENPGRKKIRLIGVRVEKLG